MNKFKDYMIGGISIVAGMIFVGGKFLINTTTHLFCKYVLKREDLSKIENYNEYTDHLSR
jgi:hypothetical protein